MKPRGAPDSLGDKVAMAARLAEREVQHHLARGDLRGADASRRSLALPAPSAAAVAPPAPADTRALGASVDREALSAGLTAEEKALLRDVEGLDADVDVSGTGGRAAKRQRAGSEAEAAAGPAARAGADAAAPSGWSDDDDSSDDEDEEAALMAELAQVRREKEEAKAAARAEEEAKAADEAEAAAARGNPLLDLGGGGGGAVQRRWDEDVVFRNQASAAPKPGRRYINDTVRNDFHKKFMRRFVQ